MTQPQTSKVASSTKQRFFNVFKDFFLKVKLQTGDKLLYIENSPILTCTCALKLTIYDSYTIIFHSVFLFLQTLFLTQTFGAVC